MHDSPDVGLRAGFWYNCHMLPRQSRLKHDKDFERIFKTGRWMGGGLVTIKYTKNEDGDAPKIGFMVGLKVSRSSVKRNLAKRRMREVVRRALKGGTISDKFDFVVIAKSEIAGKTYRETGEDIKSVLNRAKILK